MVANPSERTPVEGLVFDALVTVLGIVQDRRFTNFKPVLDVYIDKHFSSASVWNQLIRSMSMLLADKSSKQLRAAIKVWHYIFRFISRSRELQKRKDAGMGGTSNRLTEHLESSFKSGLACTSRSLLLASFERELILSFAHV
jgi:dedicator of cytokinesis protein 3